MRQLVFAVALGAAFVSPAAGQVQRPIQPGGTGPNRLALDADLLAHAQPFHVAEVAAAEGRTAVATGGAGDLRLYDASNKEVPYLLVTPQVEAQWRGARLLRVAPTKTTSGFEADLESLLPIDRLRIAGLPAPFLKRVRIEGSGDRSHWTLLVSDGTLFDLPNDQLELTSIDFATGSYRYLRVTWDDRSSARMPLPRRVEARVASAVRGPAPLRASVAVERRPSEPGKSRFRLRLPGAHLPIVAIELAVGGGNVLRTARITEGRLDGSTVVPTELGTATLRRSVRDGLAAASLRIPISTPSEAQLELAVDDGNNPPLDVTGATYVIRDTGETGVVSVSASAVDGPGTLTWVFGPRLPTSADQCKKEGWKSYGAFKNQGDCVSYVATKGKNKPAGKDSGAGFRVCAFRA